MEGGWEEVSKGKAVSKGNDSPPPCLTTEPSFELCWPWSNSQAFVGLTGRWRKERATEEVRLL